jgi:LPS export ABC transporter protein LptC
VNSQWLTIVTLLAALMIGYSVLNNRDVIGLDRLREQPVLLGYSLKDAIITETSESGAPRVRFATTEATQDVQDNSVMLSAVRADYLLPVKDRGANQSTDPTNGQVNHWVLNADQARIPAVAKQSVNRIELRGNVDAHSVDATHDTSLHTQSLNIDTNKKTAQTAELVQFDVDGNVATGHGLVVDMEKDRVQLQSNGTLRLAANSDNTSSLSLPDVFAWDTLNFKDNVFVLTKVRSKSEPFISADHARATGADLANNQWVLSGAVRLELPNRGLLNADLATITVRSNHIVNVQLSGAPVNFQHQRKNDQTIYGRANDIDYDVPAQILRIPGEAWFRLDTIEWKQESTEYNLVTGEANGKQGTGTSTPTPKKKGAPNQASKE